MRARQYTVNRTFKKYENRKIIIWTPTKRDYRKDLKKNFIPLEQLKGIKNLKSLFSDKLDPSVHGHRIKRHTSNNYELKAAYIEHRRRRLKTIREVQMAMIRNKDVATEARDIQDIARQYSLDAMRTLADILSNPESNDTAKIAAANVILDRGYGKAAATNINMNASLDAPVKDLDSRDLDQRITETLNRIDRVTHQVSEKDDEEPPTDRSKYN
jgi:hypothetical protein